MRCAAVLLSLTILGGADSCPLRIGQADTEQDSATTGDGLDLGGTRGAEWQVTHGGSTELVLEVGESAFAAVVDARLGVAQLGTSIVNLAGVCHRADLACPHQVLADRTLIVQPYDAVLLVSFQRRGPLAKFPAQVALPGQLSAGELTIPLDLDGAIEGLCGFQPASAIIATAKAADDKRATSITGRVTVSYSANCLNLSGGVALPQGAKLSLSAAFEATRR
jgi:hypothetical protein